MKTFLIKLYLIASGLFYALPCGAASYNNGATLYQQNCAGCHGALESSSRRNRTAVQIRSAITNVTSMQSLSGLSNAQLDDISYALSNLPPTPTPTPTPTPAPQGMLEVTTSNIPANRLVVFKTPLAAVRAGSQDSNFVRFGFPDDKQWIEVKNASSASVTLKEITIAVPDVSISPALSAASADDIVLAPNQVKRFNLLYRPSQPSSTSNVGQNFSMDDALVIKTSLANSMHVKLVGKSTYTSDLNYDGAVNFADLAILAKEFGKNNTMSSFDPGADVNGNGKIDLPDLPIFSGEFGVSLQQTASVNPSVPSNLGASVLGDETIVLGWSEMPEAEGYLVERAQNAAGPFAAYPKVYGSQNVFRADDLAAATTYYFRVSALSGENVGQASAVVSATTLAETLTGVGVVKVVNTAMTFADIIWNNAKGEDGYIIMLRDYSQTNAVYVEVKRVGKDVTSARIENLKPNVAYDVLVKSYAGSKVKDAQIPVRISTPPSTGTVTITLDKTTPTSFTLRYTFSDTSGAVPSQKIWLGLSQDKLEHYRSFTQFADAAGTGLVISDLAEGSTYYVQLQLLGDRSNVLSVTLPRNAQAQSMQTGLTAQILYGNTANYVQDADARFLSYLQVRCSPVDGYEIQVKKDASNSKWQTVANLVPAQTWFTFDPQNFDTRFTYQVKVIAKRASGNLVAILPLKFTSQNLRDAEGIDFATGVALSATSAHLFWSSPIVPNSHDISYAVEMQKGAVWQVVGAKIPSSSLSYIVYDLQPATTYKFRIRKNAFDYNSGPLSPEFNVTTPAINNGITLSAPMSLAALPLSATAVSLTWKDGENEDAYHIESSTDNATFKEVLVVAKNTANTLVHNLAPGSLHYFRIRAVRASLNGPYSASVSAQTLQLAPTAPQNLTASAVSASAISLTWEDVQNETGYKVERRAETENIFTEIASLNAEAISYQVTGLNAGYRYFFRVKGFNANRQGLYSVETSAVTMPSLDGEALYQTNCSGCHGTLADSVKKGRQASDINQALANVPPMSHLRTLTQEQVRAIAYVLNKGLDSNLAAVENVADLGTRYYWASALLDLFFEDEGAYKPLSANLVVSEILKKEEFGGGCDESSDKEREVFASLAFVSAATPGCPSGFSGLEMRPGSRLQRKGQTWYVCNSLIKTNAETVLSKAALNSSAALTLTNIAKLGRAFFPQYPLSANIIDSLYALGNEASASGKSLLEQWKLIMVPLCTSALMEI